MQKIVRVLIVQAVFVFAASLSLAQQPTASLTGLITDPNGAVVPGAVVTVTNKATNLIRTATTNDEGVFTISGLPVGLYTANVKASGFDTKTSSADITLTVGQTVRLDTQLDVGKIEVVDLVGEIPNIDTGMSKVDAVINNRTIENLPLNGRNFLELALLTPGNAPAPNFDPTKTNTVVISSAGQVGRGGNVMIDGTDNNDDVVGGALINVSQDAVAEFQVATNRYSAEYGRSASSVINVVTKSGTNMLHGSASFFERDRRLQGLPATFDRSQPDPPFDRQQYSFTFGGPFIKDKLFGFGAAEYRDQDGAVLVGIRDVPNRRITNGFAPAPLRDLLLNGRVDYTAIKDNSINFRYSFEDVDATDSSKLDRAIGSASYRQILKNRFHSFMTTWPDVATSSRIRSLMIVDLPAPLGPTRKTKSPSGMTRSTSRSAVFPFG